MAKDVFHSAVIQALHRDGWTITHDPFYIKIEDVEFFVDLGAERVLAAQKGGQRIAVEIKSFIGTSEIHDFHLALGQVLNYKLALKQVEPKRVLYLAIARDTYEDFFARQFIQSAIAEYEVKLMIFDPVRETVVLWKE
ncbi:MAG: XisH family protein [Cyanobacteria bacterium J06626_23]